jgi:hypothetical protein
MLQAASSSNGSESLHRDNELIFYGILQVG